MAASSGSPRSSRASCTLALYELALFAATAASSCSRVGRSDSGKSMRLSVAAIGPPPPGDEGRAAVSPTRIALGLVSRYALLLAAGYVIIARLHLHPLGVLVGVSAVVIAATVEAARAWR